MDNEAIRRAAGSNSVKDVAKHYEGYLKPIWDQQNLLDQVSHQAFGGLTAKEIAWQLEQVNPAFKVMEEARKSLDRFGDHFAYIDFSQFEAGRSEEREVVAAAEEITKAATGEPTLQEAVDKIIAAIEAQQHPAVKVMLWLHFKNLLKFLIGTVVSAVMSVYITAAMTPGASPQAETKVVKEIARQVVGTPELLMEYRYVSAKVLIVRQNARTDY